MNIFKSVIEVIGDGAYANDLVEFNNKSTVGSIPEDVVIVGDVTSEEIDISLYTVYEISKVQWQTSDGKFYSDYNISHKFASSGVYQIKLTLWSEPFLTNDGRKFYFTHSSYKDVTIESKILKTFLQFNPTWELTKNDASHDFYKASANFFEKIYRDTTGLFDLWDAETINPKFFEYLAITLGHTSDYSKKVGYQITDNDFSTYDIYDRIKKGMASDSEIQSFRRFLLMSSELFRKKGSHQSIERFLSLFTIDAKVIELWTKNWGQTPVGEIDENFIGFDLENNKHGFVWQNIRVVGNCVTEKGYIRKNLSSITLDNYHDVEKIEYPSAVVGTVTSGENVGWEQIEIRKKAPYVFDIRTDNGNTLVSEESYQEEPFVYDLVPNDPPISDETKLGLLLLKPDTVEIGDRLVVSYYGTESTIFDSILATKEKKAMDFDARAKFVLKEVVDPNKFESFKYSENEVFVLFRGNRSNVDLYSTFDEYYKVSVNGKRGTASLVKVSQNTNGSVVYQKLNTSGDRNAVVYDSQIFVGDDAACPTELKYDTFYELEVRVSGTLVSAYLYVNDSETQIQNNIDSDSGGNNYGINSCSTPITLFENVSLDQDSAQIITNDAEGNDVVDKTYTPISVSGNYGFGIRAAIVELKDFYMNILDADETLYTDTEKEFNLKPKYLSYKQEMLLYNNNDTNNNVFYNQPITTSFNTSSLDYDVDTKSLNVIYADKVPVNENVATRYTLTFDEAWMNSKFKNTSELFRKILIPYGSQRRWFIPDSRAYNVDTYKNYYGGYDLYDSKGFIPGLFRYNDSIVLDTYDLEPEDSFSSLTRNSTLNFTASSKIAQYALTGKGFGFRGMFQEVCPHSNNFASISQSITLPDGSTFVNKVLQPITVDTPTGVRTIGVRFKNCDDIERLITVNSTALYKSVQLYGHFSMDVSAESIRYCPDKIDFKAHPTKSDTYVVKFFVPLGILDKNRRTYSLNSEFLQLEDNVRSDEITIEGIYVRNPKDYIIYNQETQSLTLDPKFTNPYEDSTLGLECRYFLSGQVTLSSGLQNFDYGSKFPTTYILNQDIRGLLSNIQDGLRPVKACVKNNTAYTFDDDYFWWLPKTVWWKRDISRVDSDYASDILSGINFNKSNTFNKVFYNYNITAGSDKPRALTFKITDGDVNPNTVYYAKVNVNLDYMGFSYSEVSQTNQTNNPLNSAELGSLNVKDGIKSTYRDFKRSPAATCMTYYVPIAWYPESPSDSKVEWFNYITGSAGSKETSPCITITPIGLMTYLINNAVDVSQGNATSAQDLINVTRSWTVEDWNKLFDNNVSVEFIAEQVPTDKYKLYNKYSVINNYPLSSGAEIKIDYNIADAVSLKWTVLDTHTIYTKSNYENVYDIPAELNSMRKWAEDVYSVTLDKLIITADNYDVVSDTKIRFKNTTLVNSLGGSSVVGRYFLGALLNDAYIKKVEDDFSFNTERSINLLPYESTGDGIFTSANRLPNPNLVLKSKDNIYNIEYIENQLVFKSINNNTSTTVDYKKTGVVNKLNNEVRFDKKVQENIQKLYAIDDNNIIFDMASYFKFDKKMNGIKNYDGKKFEFILKAETIYDNIRNKNVLGSYYFVGVGVYNFDVAIGVARYNVETGVMDKSFLAGFGEYNTRGVNTDTWYKLRTIVTEDFIRVIFNEKNQPDRLVINYSINKKIQTDTSRYIDGSFEEMVYLVTGLDKMSITYPGKLGEKTSSLFSSENFNDSLVKTTRPIGTISGMVFHNELTYVEKLEYTSQVPGDKVYGDTNVTTDVTSFISKISSYGYTTIDYISNTTNNTLVIRSGTNLFYMLPGKELNIYSKEVVEAYTSGDYVVVRYTNGNVEIIYQDFKKAHSVYVKDLTFYNDHILNYIKFTNRSIKRIWSGKDKVYVEFCNIPICMPWNESYWNNPEWSCIGRKDGDCDI
jgi:hypothetical protein